MHEPEVGGMEIPNVLSRNVAPNVFEQKRPSWSEWGLNLAAAVATRADCSRRRIGAVIMRPDHTVVSTGYNGSPPGDKSCLEGFCPRGRMNNLEVAPGSSYDTGAGACIALHAEQNAVLRASWDEMVLGVMYITDVPCDGCMRMLRGTPLQAVRWPDGYKQIR